MLRHFVTSHLVTLPPCHLVIRVKHGAQIQAKMRLKQFTAVIDRLAEERFAGVEGAGHVDILGTLAGEEQGDWARFAFGRGDLGQHPCGVALGQSAHSIGCVAAKHDAPMGEKGAPYTERIGHIGQIEVGVGSQVSGQVVGHRL